MQSVTCASLPADVSVELAVCCLLLGDSERAEDVLDLAAGSSGQQADPAVRSFVLVRASHHATLVPARLFVHESCMPCTCLYTYLCLCCLWVLPL